MNRVDVRYPEYPLWPLDCDHVGEDILRNQVNEPCIEQHHLTSQANPSYLVHENKSYIKIDLHSVSKIYFVNEKNEVTSLGCKFDIASVLKANKQMRGAFREELSKATSVFNKKIDRISYPKGSDSDHEPYYPYEYNYDFDHFKNPSRNDREDYRHYEVYYGTAYERAIDNNPVLIGDIIASYYEEFIPQLILGTIQKVGDLLQSRLLQEGASWGGLGHAMPYSLEYDNASLHSVAVFAQEYLQPVTNPIVLKHINTEDLEKALSLREERGSSQQHSGPRVQRLASLSKEEITVAYKRMLEQQLGPIVHLTAQYDDNHHRIPIEVLELPDSDRPSAPGTPVLSPSSTPPPDVNGDVDDHLNLEENLLHPADEERSCMRCIVKSIQQCGAALAGYGRGSAVS